MTLVDYNASNSNGMNPPPTVPTAVLASPNQEEPEINVNATSTATATTSNYYNNDHNKQDQYAYAYAAEAQIINDTPGVPASSQVLLIGQVTSTASPSSNPPGNCPDGGQWGVMEYVGNKTTALACLGCLCFGLFGLCFLACPQDEKDAYRVNGKLYDAEGTLIGPVSRYKFTPTRGPSKGGGGGLRS
jgi:hypothetical protein